MVTEVLAARADPNWSYTETSEKDWLLGLAKSEDGKSFVAELRRKKGAVADVASRQLLVAEARLQRVKSPPSILSRIWQTLLACKIYVAVGCVTAFVLWLIAFAGAITGLRACCCDGSTQTTECCCSSLFMSCKPTPNEPFLVCF
ncbi:uncharacterized protein LOC126354689 [Schistocerca gregaria]|uniref:uncharacterized protein LOC126354689 n=1 Tax=Schistocerca gregaria TaxID=7010 RepID=UPI00211DFE94|nr:uncharacterized protein LOC126354689 [Schistocerca gregaria]